MPTYRLHIPTAPITTMIATEAGVLSRCGEELRGQLRASQVTLVTDETVGGLYGRAALMSLQRAGFATSLFTLPPGEASKSLASAERCYQHLAERAFGRDGLIVALGGGVVSDLAGFVAATWMRGVQWAICPTTLEAMIDASIGGKTAVNVPGGKNLVGAFYHPRMVLIDPDCLSTLPDRDLHAGLAESIKHAALFAPEFFEWHERNAEAILRREPQVLSELIDRNVAIKVDVVQRDANEQSGQRMLLNLGHTIGHAIEECCGFELRHGECVALGMVAAATLSEFLGLLDSAAVERIRGLASRLQLPTRLSPIPWPRILEVMRRDKKARDGKLKLVLLEGIGKPVIRGDVEEAVVRRAYQSIGGS